MCLWKLFFRGLDASLCVCGCEKAFVPPLTGWGQVTHVCVERILSKLLRQWERLRMWKSIRGSSRGGEREGVWVCRMPPYRGDTSKLCVYKKIEKHSWPPPRWGEGTHVWVELRLPVSVSQGMCVC